MGIFSVYHEYSQLLTQRSLSPYSADEKEV